MGALIWLQAVGRLLLLAWLCAAQQVAGARWQQACQVCMAGTVRLEHAAAAWGRVVAGSPACASPSPVHGLQTAPL